MDTSKQCCPNSTGAASAKMGDGTSTIHDRKWHRYRGKHCQQTFSARRSTMVEGLRKPEEVIAIVVTPLISRCPVQAIVLAFGLHERTVGSPA